MTQGDIHNHQNIVNNLEKDLKNHSKITEKDKEILVKGLNNAPSFLTYLRNQGMSKSRIRRYMYSWKRITQYTNWEILEADKTKIATFIGHMSQDQFHKKDGTPFSESTKREYKKSIRKMYTDYIQEYQEELGFEDTYNGEDLINFTLTIDRNFTDPDRLPKPRHIKELVETADRPRDKAYIMTLWSTGGRNGEVLGLKWKDVKFTNSIGKAVFRDTKTGGDHTVPLAEAYPFIKRHRNEDPESKNTDRYVFRSQMTDTQLSSTGAANIIMRVKEKTDIPDKIKVNPHAFRKARASYWARQGKGEAWICKHMNWVQGNAIVSHYCRIAQEDVEQGVAEHLNLEVKDKQGDEESKVLTPCECYDCGAVNSFEADVCEECGTVLDSSDLFIETQIEEKSVEFMEEVIKSETGFEPEEFDEKAEEFVKDELLESE